MLAARPIALQAVIMVSAVHPEPLTTQPITAIQGLPVVIEFITVTELDSQ